MKFSFDNFAKEGLHEECGVFGIFSDGTINPAYACYNGLLALQHRGQESCGIAVSDEGVIDYHKDMGLVTEVFNNKILDSLNGQMAVSHVRYSTAGGSVLENAQPLVMRYVRVRFQLLITATLPMRLKSAEVLNSAVQSFRQQSTARLSAM